MYDLSNNNLGLDDEDPTTPPSSFIQYFTTSVFYKKEYALIDKYVSSVREALKNCIFYDNLLISIATLPNYDINFYDKALIIDTRTHLQVIMTKIKINCSSISFIFNGKVDKRYFKFNKIH